MIDILIVNEDLNTTVKILHGIEYDEGFSQIQRIADELQLTLISTIDPWGDTVINRPGQAVLAKELARLRGRTDINQELVNAIQHALDVVGSGEYIRFMGD